VGYLLKERVGAVEDFPRTIERVVDGDAVLDPDVVRTLMRRGRSPLAALTARERDVLELVAQGDRNGEIAAKLHVTETVIESEEEAGPFFCVVAVALLENSTAERRGRDPAAALQRSSHGSTSLPLNCPRWWAHAPAGSGSGFQSALAALVPHAAITLRRDHPGIERSTTRCTCSASNPGKLCPRSREALIQLPSICAAVDRCVSWGWLP
jgi:hypothetical protein